MAINEGKEMKQNKRENKKENQKYTKEICKKFKRQGFINRIFIVPFQSSFIFPKI
jgi:hypothetical protein